MFVQEDGVTALGARISIGLALNLLLAPALQHSFATHCKLT